MKQVDLAGRLGVSKSYLSEIESGKKKPSFEILEGYSSVFELPLSSIMIFYEQYDSAAKNNARDFIAGKALRLLEWMTDAKCS
jgi:transcriptional regulator with XRE-family HTH domain